MLRGANHEASLARRTHRARTRKRRAFTLVELMIVVAIIGILASVAVPNYSVFVLRAKKSEAYVCLDGIRTAEYAYEAAFDSFLEAPANPSSALSKSTRPWNISEGNWYTLNWEPTGGVRCTYQVNTFDSNSWFRADSFCDLDGNGEVAIIRLYSWNSGGPGTFEEPYPLRY